MVSTSNAADVLLPGSAPAEGTAAHALATRVTANHAAFAAALDQVRQHVAEGHHEAALQAASDCAHRAWMQHSGLFASPELESLLAQVGQALPPAERVPPPEAAPRRVLTVLTSVHAVGGHSRIAWRWIGIDTGSQHTLVLTQQEGRPLPEQLQALAQAGRVRIVQLDAPSWLGRATALRDEVAQADQVVLLTHPHDVLPCTAVPAVRNAPPVLAMDHASHVFWLGVGISTLAINTATMVLEHRRGIARTHIGWALLPMDFSRLEHPSGLDVRAAFGIPAEAPLLLSAGSPFKYWPIEGTDLAALLTPVLEQHPDAHLLVVGVAEAPYWQPFLQRFAGRVHLSGYLPEPDLAACYHACDVYVDSVPLSSPTTVLEAAALGKPIVRYAPADWRGTGFSLEFDCIPADFYLWSTPEAYAADIHRLLCDATLRGWRGSFGRAAVRLYYADDTFRHSIEALYAKAATLPRIVPDAQATAARCERIDTLLVQLADNMAAQQALDATRGAQKDGVATAGSLEYVHWLEGASVAPGDALLPALRDAGASVVLAVAVSDSPGGAASMAATQESLAAQLRPADRVASATAGEPLSALIPALEDSGWTLCLCAGDTLAPDALAQLARALAAAPDTALVAYLDHDERDAGGRLGAPCLKPAFNHDLLLSCAYMGRALAVRTAWLAERAALAPDAGRFSLAFAYGLMLAALRERGAGAFLPVPVLALHLTAAEPAVFATDSATWQAMAQHLAEHAAQTEPGSQLLEGPLPGSFHLVPPLPRTPMVSIIIPTRDQLPFLSRCIESLLAKTAYPAFELLVVDNDSQTAEAREFLAGLEGVMPDRIRVLRAPGPFNFSRMNNLAAREARGEYLLLLNNDTAALQADWLTHLVRQGLRPGVGAVGARLLFPDGRVQHAGVVLGLCGPADHPLLGLPGDQPGYQGRAQLTQDFSAVTAACLLVSRAVYDEVGGLDESQFGVSYNDVDFCLRIGATGRRIVWTPLATLLHEGSASQRAAVEGKTQQQKLERFSAEQAAFYARWPALVARDPHYSPHLSLSERNYEIETRAALRPDPLQGLAPHHVAVFAADATGCGQYRVLQPLAAMRDAGLCTGAPSPELLPTHLLLRTGADTLVFQRPYTDAGLAALAAAHAVPGVRTIYEVDDHMAQVPVKSIHHQDMPKDLRGRILKGIGMCDRLVVSTEPLAQALGPHAAQVRVAPNRLPPRMWGSAPPVRPAMDSGPRRKPRIGWAGGAGHQGDLDMIADVVRELAGEVEWVFFGMCPPALRPYVGTYYAGVPTLEYPRQLMAVAQSWDLAIAPLEANDFNECKSNLRLLEYGWCGVPVVCSDVLPYQGGGLQVRRVRNRFKDWVAALRERIADLPAARQEGAALQQQVSQDWVLRGDALADWYRAWTD